MILWMDVCFCNRRRRKNSQFNICGRSYDCFTSLLLFFFDLIWIENGLCLNEEEKEVHNFWFVSSKIDNTNSR